MNSPPSAPAANESRRPKAYLQAVLASMPQGICVFDELLRLRVWNRRFIEILGLPIHAVFDGAHFDDIYRIPALRGDFGAGNGDEHVARQRELAGNNQPFSVEQKLGYHRTYLVHGEPLAIDARQAGMVIIYTDISEQRATAEREQLAQMVFSHTPAGIILTDEGQRILSINPATTQMTGYESFELLGHTVFSLLDESSPERMQRMTESLAENGSWHDEVPILRKTGTSFPAGVRINRIDDTHEETRGHHVWILADITERKEAEERMRHIAQHDTLTGLPNRLSLHIRLAQLLPESRRHQWRIAIMFIDLDRFKIINDTLGHQIGDELLREVACRLSSVVRETDFVARLGGDEFVIILPGIATPGDAAVVASKIIASLSMPVEADGHELHTSPSIGISIFPDDGPDGDTILKNADTAMYHAKSAGRNNYQFFAANMNHAATERLDIERKLRHAITRNELALCFQPQFRANGSQPTGVEALLRWHHPTDGMISPDRFIPVAEETGLIVNIGEWVLRQACIEMKQWIDAGLKPLRVAVNVSARQLRRRDFCETVAGALAESGLPPELLELEITESSVMENPQDAIQILESLGRMGVTLAIDDFGTGYSSLAYLKLFPIDHLKIDRSFVRDIELDLNDRAIAFGTIALAHSLGLRVIAEGVETPEQLDLLSTHGCDEVQGYLFSKPLNSAAAFAFLHALSRAE
ncbi:MAG: EAL domain-containing protein [Azonexus sp.]|nr:EAL domain-containing protein [Azonexus sp.]